MAAAHREHRGRLLALLAARFGRLDLAEDGLADAYEAATRTWSVEGVPTKPAAWLLTAARHRILDRQRSEAVAARKLPLLAVDAVVREEAQVVMADAGNQVTDERLRLVLLCAHPRLAPEHAAALTLRLVLGVRTPDIARLFLVPTATMAARLTRARKRLGGAAFSVPSGDELGERIGVAAQIAYLAFTTGYAPGSGADVVRADVASEAVRLVRVLREVARPVGDASNGVELDALLALVLLQHSRRDARVRDGELVLLPDQNRRLWNQREIVEAIDLLTPLASAPASPYLLQALIAAEHAVAPSSTETAWHRVLARYDELLALTDSPVVRLNRAVALAERDGAAAGLAALDAIDPAGLPGHRLPATRADLLARVGRPDAAIEAYDVALARCENAAEARHLSRRRASVTGA